METFRIEVGLLHQVKPANIVGAIANETGLDGRSIGRIQLFDEFSTVDMLAGIPAKMLQILKERQDSGAQAGNLAEVDSTAAVCRLARTQGTRGNRSHSGGSGRTMKHRARRIRETTHR